MFKKTTLLILVILLLGIMVCGCSKNNNKDNENANTNQTQTEQSNESNELKPGDKLAVSILKETEEKITEEFEEYGIGKIKFIHSTTSSITSLRNMQIAIGDILIVDDYQYVFMKKYNETGLQDYDFCGFSVKAIGDSKSFSQMYDVLFGAEVLNADYCFYNNKKIETLPKLSSKLLSANHCFDGCENLALNGEELALYELSDLIEADFMFANCLSIKNVGYLPKEITSANGMFLNCIKLESCTTIPEKLLTLNNMFENCTALTGTITFEGTPTEYKDIFKNTQKDIIIACLKEVLIMDEYKNITIMEGIS